MPDRSLVASSSNRISLWPLRGTIQAKPAVFSAAWSLPILLFLRIRHHAGPFCRALHPCRFCFGLRPLFEFWVLAKNGSGRVWELRLPRFGVPRCGAKRRKTMTKNFVEIIGFA